MTDNGAVALRTLSASVARLVSAGRRKLFITSAGPGEGKTSVAAALGLNLARWGRHSVALLDIDRVRPRLHKLFNLDPHRGLGELLHEVYHVDLSREKPEQFGVGDWIELLRAQSKTGMLSIGEGKEEFSITFVKGRVSSLYGRQGDDGRYLGDLLVKRGRISQEQLDAALRVREEGSQPLGGVLSGLGYVEAAEVDSALQSQIKERLHRIVTLRRPQYKFSETIESYLPAAGGRSSYGSDGIAINELVTRMVGDHLKQPFLSSQVPSYLMDTAVESLKVLTCGTRPYDLSDAHYTEPIGLLLDRLARSFDVVLVDSPPVAFDSPTSALAPMGDGVLFVVKANGLPVNAIQRAREQLERSGATVLGVILNQVDLLKGEHLPYYHGAYR